MTTIIFISDGWGTKFGGINSFNYDLCLNFASNLDCNNHKIVCITTGVNEDDIILAREKELVLINLSPSDLKPEIIIKKTSIYCANAKVWWIGHDIKTGFLAVECAKSANGNKCAIIHHMNYSAYYTYVVNNPIKAKKKNDEQRKLFKKADLIFAVGPKLTQSANDILLKSDVHKTAIQLIPGIADIIPIEEPLNQFTAITFGRLNMNNKDIIKQCKLAVASFGYSCKHDNNFLSGDAKISLIGLENNEVEKINSELRKYVSEFADRLINVEGYPYTEKRDELFDLIKCSSVCMMLSIHEGFGLAGWEAISAGVPLIISKNSGLFDFLNSINVDLKVSSIDIRGDLEEIKEGEDFQGTDVENVSKILINIKNNSKTYKKAALELRDYLINEGYTWAKTSLTMLKEMGIETKEKTRHKHLLSIVKEQLDLISETKKYIIDNWNEIVNEFDCAKTYNMIRDAHSDIANDIRNSNFLKVHGMRCSTICPSNDNAITDVLNKINRSINIEILMASPFSEYIRKRLITLPEYNNSERDLILHHREMYHTAKTFKSRERYNTRFFNLPLKVRLYFTQQNLYLSFYEDGIHARNSKVFCFEANTKTYSAFKEYYANIWINSTDKLPNIPEEVSSEYRYIFGNYWFARPSLVINICSSCDMNCKYCPNGGENLKLIDNKEYCDSNSISTLVKNFPSCGGNSVIRITGGEPLLNSSIRKRTNLVLKAAGDYDKIVLCTNAIHLQEAYEEDRKTWETVKSKLLLKISFDTLIPKTFKEITGNTEKLLDTIKQNIQFAKSKGFNIELNFVAQKLNVNEVLQVFEFAKTLELIGIKVLTVNDFGGIIKIEDSEQKYVESSLEKTINYLRQNKLEEIEASLNDGVGIRMKRFLSTTVSNNICTLTIVDHNIGEKSITPKRLYCNFCRKCNYFPCATGIMNLTLRADGMLSQCRLKTDNLFNINGNNNTKIKNQVKKMIEPFGKCFLYDDKGELVDEEV